jgi:CheY-like chemotaxis protein
MGRVLVIDDDGAIRGTMRKILERDGHEVREAADGRRGLELFRAEGADVVVTDIIMPEKEGIETILELREASPDVRILAVSGGDAVLGGGERLQDARALGADASLPKPFTVDQLRNAVAELLGD